MPQPLKLLIAEDNPADAEMLLRALRRAGFEPDWRRVDTERDYLEQLNASLDLVLSDYEMPQFSGLRALELLKGSGLEVPLIIVSGTIGEDTAVAAMKLGAADYLLKDRLARVGQAVGQALEQSRLRRERERVESALHESERFAQAALDSLTAHIAILDEQGVILAVNGAWRAFASDNGLAWERAGTGANYLRVCEDAVGPCAEAAQQVAASIREGLAGRANGTETEYPCHSATEQRWFVVRVTAFPGDGPRRVVVAHDNITARKQAEERIREQLAELLRWQEVMLDREDRVQGLKAEVNELLIQKNQPRRYAGPSAP